MTNDDDAAPEEIADAALESGDENVEVFLRRNGREGLERAAAYAIEYAERGVNHRIAAGEQD